MAYLRNKHDITNSTRREVISKKRQLSIKESISIREQHPYLRRRLIRPSNTIKGNPLKILFVRLLTTGNLLTSLVKSNEFRDFLFFINRDVKELLLKAYLTVNYLVKSIKDLAFLSVKARLLAAKSKVYISYDKGILPNNKLLFAVVAYFISVEGQLKQQLLSLKEVFRRYTSKNLA